MNPEKEEYCFLARQARARDKKASSNFAEMPQPTPASFGVLIACTGTPPAFNTEMYSSACARERNTAKTLIICPLLS